MLQWYRSTPQPEEVRRALAEGLQHATGHPPEVIDKELKTLLNDPSKVVQLAAISSAQELDRASLLEALADRVNEPITDIARAAVRALKRSTQREAKVLLKRLARTYRLSPLRRELEEQSITSP